MSLHLMQLTKVSPLRSCACKEMLANMGALMNNRWLGYIYVTTYSSKPADDRDWFASGINSAMNI